jgi:hypothetical protein
MATTASELMQREPIVASPLWDVAEFERAFFAEGCGGFPVVRDGELVGVVSRSGRGPSLRPDPYVLGGDPTEWQTLVSGERFTSSGGPSEAKRLVTPLPSSSFTVKVTTALVPVTPTELTITLSWR